MKLNRRLIGILAAFAILVGFCGVALGSLDDYQYKIPLTIINNSGSPLDNTMIPFPINAVNLVSSNFVQADGDDIEMALSGGAELQHFTEDMDQNDAYWWISPADHDDGLTKTYYVHMGDTSLSDDAAGPTTYGVKNNDNLWNATLQNSATSNWWIQCQDQDPGRCLECDDAGTGRTVKVDEESVAHKYHMYHSPICFDVSTGWIDDPNEGSVRIYISAKSTVGYAFSLAVYGSTPGTDGIQDVDYNNAHVDQNRISGLYPYGELTTSAYNELVIDDLSWLTPDANDHVCIYIAWYEAIEGADPGWLDGSQEIALVFDSAEGTNPPQLIAEYNPDVVDQSIALGSGDNVTVSHAASLNITTNLTMETKVDMAAVPSSEYYLLHKPAEYYLSAAATDFTAAVYNDDPTAEAVNDGSNDTDHDAGNPSNLYWEAQTFLTGADVEYLDELDLYMRKVGAPTTLTMEIFATSAGLPAGSALVTQDTAGTGIGTSMSWETVAMPIYTLSANTTYAVTMRCKSGGTCGASNYFEWQSDNTSPAYADGSRAYSSDGGSSWAADTTEDYNFHVDVKTRIEATATVSTAEVEVKATADGSNLKLYLDDVLEDMTAYTTAIRTGTEDLAVEGQGEYLYTRVGDTALGAPTWKLDLHYEPDEIALTDEGDSGDSWTWEGTVTDQSASSNDGTYQITADTSGLIITVGNLSLKTFDDTVVDEDIVDMIGDPGMDGDTSSDSDTWLFRAFFDSAEGNVDSNISTDAFWFVFVGVFTIFGGAVTFIATYRFAGYNGALLFAGLVMFTMLMVGYFLTPLDFWIALIGGAICLIAVPTLGRFASSG